MSDTNIPTPTAPTATPPKSRDVMSQNPEGQKKWLEQRGWIPGRRDMSEMWRHPETGVRYIFEMAFKLALQDCKLPADYELVPDLPKRKADDLPITDAKV